MFMCSFFPHLIERCQIIQQFCFFLEATLLFPRTSLSSHAGRLSCSWSPWILPWCFLPHNGACLPGVFEKGLLRVDVLSRLFKTSLLHLYTGLRTYLGLEVSRLETIPQKTSGLAPLRSSLLCCHWEAQGLSRFQFFECGQFLLLEAYGCLSVLVGLSHPSALSAWTFSD